MTQQNMTTLLNDCQIALNKLTLHPRNVRAGSATAYSEAAILPLAANIAARGLLQPLVVQKLESGSYGVVGGGRRLAALKMLASDTSAKGFSKAMKVPCRKMAEDDTAVSTVSFSENALQLPMDALERYEAFAAMRDQDGVDIGAIARAFAITDRVVKEALRLGNIHGDIRAAYRADQLNLDALRAFNAHPDPAVQLETFTALVQEHGQVTSWQVRGAFQNRWVRIGDALGSFVLEAYRAAGGEVIADLIEEDSILADSTLINKLQAEGLEAAAEAERVRLGFAWAEYRTEANWDSFSDYGRVYPEALDLDEATQARVDALTEQMDAIAAEFESVADVETEEALEERHTVLEVKLDDLTHGYSEGDLGLGGVIAVWERGALRFHHGMVRPDQMPERSPDGKAAGITAPQANAAQQEVVGPKFSAKLAGDMAHVRTRAMGLALAQSPEVARDYAEFTLIQQVLDWYPGNTTSLRADVASRGPDEVGGSLAQIEEVFETLRGGLELDWIEMKGADGFAAFRALPDAARADLLAYTVAQTLEPKLVTDLRDPVRAAVEVEVLPNLRDVWTPDEVFLKRLTKPDLLEILRDMDLRSEAQAYHSEKKSSLVAYMVKLFAEPFATLTDKQRSAVTGWCPAVMTREVADDAPEDAPADEAKTEALAA